jgi:hypothetical protein
MRDHELKPSRACEFGGWINQLSVSATDFAILAISISTLLVVRQKARLVHVSLLQTLLICSSTWFIPLITSTTVTALGEMKPVSGNWCWISKERTDLRYGMTHGFRMAIIFVTVGIYSYIWWYVSRHFKSIRGIYGSRSGRFSRSLGSSTLESSTHSEGDAAANTVDPSAVAPTAAGQDEQKDAGAFRVDVDRQFRVNSSEVGESQESLVEDDDSDIEAIAADVHEMRSPTRAEPNQQKFGHHVTIAPRASITPSQTPRSYLRDRTRQTERDVKRMLMMNGYPIFYVILWIPGLTNRILEASGTQTTSRVLAVLQCSTQYIGFANSVTYGLSGIWRKGS